MCSTSTTIMMTLWECVLLHKCDYSSSPVSSWTVLPAGAAPRGRAGASAGASAGAASPSGAAGAGAGGDPDITARRKAMKIKCVGNGEFWGAVTPKHFSMASYTCPHTLFTPFLLRMSAVLYVSGVFTNIHIQNRCFACIYSKKFNAPCASKSLDVACDASSLLPSRAVT